MNILACKGKIEAAKCDAIVLFYCDGKKGISAQIKKVDDKLDSTLVPFMKKRKPCGELYRTESCHTHGVIPAEYVIIAGLGKKTEFNIDKLRGAAGKVAQCAQKLNLKNIAYSLDGSNIEGDAVTLAIAISEGTLSAAYKFDTYKSEKTSKSKLEQIRFITEERALESKLNIALKNTQKLMDTVAFVRDIVSTPSNDMTPIHLAASAKKLSNSKLKVSVLEEKQIQSMGMLALYNVAKGSNNKPRFIIMEYYGGAKGAAPIVLVGKGLTFDSGGISLKSAENMGEMKTDMAGAAAVIGTMSAISALGIKQSVIGLVPALENMPDGNSYKPGDIVKSLAGHTIEITNTDAEGRLALADALAYATRFKPALIVDVATLTGACSIALGRDLIGMMSNSEKYKNKIKDAAQATGEYLWELPLWDNYTAMIKSDIADYKNSSGRDAATITAGLFLSKFVGKYPWIHLDIASTVWLDKPKPYIPAGATAIGVRLLVRFIEDLLRR